MLPNWQGLSPRVAVVGATLQGCWRPSSDLSNAMQPWCGRLPQGALVGGRWVAQALRLGAPTPEIPARTFVGARRCQEVPGGASGFSHCLPRRLPVRVPLDAAPRALAHHAPRRLTFFSRRSSSAIYPSLRRVCSFLLFCKPYRSCSDPSSFTQERTGDEKRIQKHAESHEKEEKQKNYWGPSRLHHGSRVT
ncbi:uncharacterized protein BO80DRAFT_51100 [Aspergillus ibericus CBS 121593]|uniref:Uncharacterized protein n=1 Tax=Aspergillus ibericus CBS 121593 TaxID=1448316 RepID=A0A395H180_9EURO|nr:hypothetical protein BO80DRAFT_51100 [Aspergillus ibericus CBS 121593]RAL01587.1 hypothetical protein BO80DRAFT_51100 [Aspergillus ibericus CBS 121593]